ncbi:MAG TPA: hypothetical protein VFL80_07375, partial [Thermoanaerobaculia bacterium]|nr:hypothetical protein [Thermoanaerobaculia bacterium]
DHSLVASMVREGLLTSQEAETHPRRNVLQRSMGVAEDVEIDVKGPFEVQHGDTFILCSDGLHGVVKEAEMLDVAKLPIDEAADEFVKRALERGAPDNVTVIVARIESPESDDPDARIGHDDPTIVGVQRPDLPGLAPLPLSAPASAAPSAAEQSPAEKSAPQPMTADADDATLRVNIPPAMDADAAPRAGGVMKWVLFVVLLLGAAGVLFFRTQHPTAAGTQAAPAAR